MFDFDSPLIDFEGRPTDAYLIQLLVAARSTGPSAAEIAAAVTAQMLGNRTLSAHIQAMAATLVGNTLGAGSSHIEFIDGSVTVEADVPLPGQVGERSNVVVTGV